MFNKTLIKYTFYKNINALIIIFLLFIFSGCGAEIGSVGRGEVSGYDSAGVNTPDAGEVINEAPQGDFIKLSWMAPMYNADGSPLTYVDGYVIYYREDYAEAETFSIDVGNVTSATIDNLSPGTWCFAVTAYNGSGRESDFSNYACKDI